MRLVGCKEVEEMNPDFAVVNKESLFQAVLNTVSDAITVIDGDLNILYQNEAVLKAYGPRTGEKCYTAYRKRQEPCENCIILDVIRDGNPKSALRDIHLPDGSVLWMEVFAGRSATHPAQSSEPWKSSATSRRRSAYPKRASPCGARWSARRSFTTSSPSPNG